MVAWDDWMRMVVIGCVTVLMVAITLALLVVLGIWVVAYVRDAWGRISRG